MRETGLLLAEREIWETLAAPSQILLSGAAAGSADLLHQNAKTAAGSAGVRQYRHSPHAKAKRPGLRCVERARLRMLLCAWRCVACRGERERWACRPDMEAVARVAQECELVMRWEARWLIMWRWVRDRRQERVRAAQCTQACGEERCAEGAWLTSIPLRRYRCRLEAESTVLCTERGRVQTW